MIELSCILLQKQLAATCEIDFKHVIWAKRENALGSLQKRINKLGKTHEDRRYHSILPGFSVWPSSFVLNPIQRSSVGNMGAFLGMTEDKEKAVNFHYVPVKLTVECSFLMKSFKEFTDVCEKLLWGTTDGSFSEIPLGIRVENFDTEVHMQVNVPDNREKEMPNVVTDYWEEHRIYTVELDFILDTIVAKTSYEQLITRINSQFDMNVDFLTPEGEVISSYDTL